MDTPQEPRWLDVDEQQTWMALGSVLTIRTEEGWAKVAATAPGHVAEVRRLVVDPLTRAQTRQLRETGRPIMRAIDPNDPCLCDQPLAAIPAQVPA